MTREESMLPREAYDALECKRTLRFNRGQSPDEETDDKDVNIMVRTTATETQNTTVRQENTQLDKTNRTSSETTPIANIRHSPVIPLGSRSEPILINDNTIICNICNNNIIRDILSWEFQFFVPISGTPIISRIPIPFLIPEILVGTFF